MKRTAIIILILLGSQNLSFAQSLEGYLQMAGENNPELKAYFSDYLAALERVPQVGSLPDPELSMGIFLKPMERYMGNQQADIQLMQMFPWFGTLGAQKDEASQMALARYEAFQDAKNRLFYQIKDTWYQMYRLDEEIRISEENLKILRTYERLALIRYQSAGGSGAGSGNMQDSSPSTGNASASSGMSMGNMGGGMNTGSTSRATGGGNTSATMAPSGTMGSGNSGMSDVLRVRIEIKGLENNLAYLNDSRLTLHTEFNLLLNRDSDENIVVADTLLETALSIDRPALLDSITQKNPMLKMLDAEGEAYEAQIKMSRLMGRPMFGAGINYMAFSPRTGDGMSMGGMDMVMPMVSVSIPIYRKKYKAMSREAELNQQAAGQRRENTVNQLTTQWTTALRDLDDASRRTELYREQSDLARQTLNLLMTGYSASGQDFEEVLRVQQQLLDYQLQLVTAVVDQHMAVAMLEMLAATELK